MQHIFRQNIFRHKKAKTLPIPAILCVAAILGCISIMLAFNTLHPTDDSSRKAASQVIIIIPASAQKLVALSLPD